MAYQVLIRDREQGWKPYSCECVTMARAYTLCKRLKKKMPHRAFRVVNLVNFEVEQWAGREAGNARD